MFFYFFVIFFEEEGVDLLYLYMFIVEERLKILELFQGEIVVAALDFAYLWKFEVSVVLGQFC